MSNMTNKEYRMLGDFLLAHLNSAKAEVRRDIAEENRGHPVANDDADTFDTQTPRRFRERYVSQAVTNINATLGLV